MTFRSLRSPFVLSLVLLAAGVARADFEHHATLSGESLLVANLVGSIVVEPVSGSNFVIDVDIRGDDAEESRVDFQADEGNESTFVVGFPLDEEDRYVYPELGRGGRTTLRFRRNRNHGSDRGAWWDRLFSDMGRRQVEIRGSGRGMEMWADLTIGVPEGKEIVVLNGVGTVEAANLSGEVVLDTHSGSIRVESIKGNVLCDTGSGHVEAIDIQGDLNVDTGSGHVEILGMKGVQLLVDTGSGHVTLEDCEAEEISVDTGSGSVELDAIECAELSVDTGSGRVHARKLGAGRAEVDTGSGSVRLELVRMGKGPFHVDTGSGGITLIVPADASADVAADAGSGGVDVDVDDIVVRRSSRDSMDFEIGEGEARVDLETGSGRIVISQR